jgi:transcription antitermination factor NusG
MSKKRFANKLHIKKGDQVAVVEGAYKGKKGKVLEVFPNEEPSDCGRCERG